MTAPLPRRLFRTFVLALIACVTIVLCGMAWFRWHASMDREALRAMSSQAANPDQTPSAAADDGLGRAPLMPEVLSAGTPQRVEATAATQSHIVHESDAEKRVRVVVEDVLSRLAYLQTDLRGLRQVRLLSVSLEENRVTLDFSKEIAAQGSAAFESATSFLMNAIHPLIQGDGINPKYSELDVKILVEGKPVSDAL
jgi:hypothetical protein